MATQEQRTSIVWDYAPAPESPDHVRLRDSYGLFIDGEFQDPVDGTRVPTINPATEEPVAEVAFAGAGDVRRAVRGGAGCPARLGCTEWAGARQVPVPHRASDPGARARARGGRVDGRRQADPRVARRGRAARRRALLPLRGLDGQALLRDGRTRRRAARRRGADRAVELPPADGGMEAGAGARRREHRRPEAGRDHAVDRAAARRDPPGGRAAAGRRVDRAGRRRHRRRARARARHRQGRLHRVDRCRQGHPDARSPGAGSR